MATWDLYATCNGMAAKWLATTPPSGETGIRKAYGQAPDGIPAFPAGVFVPQRGSVTVGAGQYAGTHEIDGFFLLDVASGDLARIEVTRQKWLPVLLHAMDADMDVGQGPVVLKVRPTGWEFVVYDYGGTKYDGIVIHYAVDTIEYVTLAA